MKIIIKQYEGTEFFREYTCAMPDDVVLEELADELELLLRCVFSSKIKLTVEDK